MKKIHVRFIMILAGLMISVIIADCQTISPSGIEFKNAPVLFKEGGKSFQQILVNYRAVNPEKLVITSSGKELLNANLTKGVNRFLLTLPAVSRPGKITLTARIGNGPAEKCPFTIVPPKKWKIYFVQHSHTDIGYTRPQSEILAEHMRYIDYALDYCDQTDNLPDDAKFRWTCESAWVTREYLRSRPSEQIRRLKERVTEKRVEVTGMFSNMAEIADENVMYDFLQPVKEISSHGINVETAMQNDVNGIAWCMPDYFKNTGVRYLIMGINMTRSILPFDKPTAFWWESPSGARLLAFRADHYMTGNNFGIESRELKAENMLWHIADLDDRGYPFDRIGIQFSGYRTDNAPPSTAACELVKQWNAKYEYPKIRLAVAGEFMEYVDRNYSGKLPVYRNAWLDWWTDGYGSTSRETAEIRKTQNIKQVDEGLLAMVTIMGGEMNNAIEGKLNHINENAIFFDEHTCGADESISHPYSENSTKQWLQKGAYAWEALKRVTLLNEEALARFQPFLSKASFPVIYVINPMGWDRSGNIELFVDNEVVPVENKVNIIDISTGRKVPAQVKTRRREGSWWIIEVNNVPAMGYKALKVEIIPEPATIQAESEKTEILENQYYRLVIDKTSGSVSSLFDKALDQDLVDPENQYHLGQPVRETSERRDVPPFIRTSVANVRVDKGINGDVWESVRISYDLDGFEKGSPGKPGGIQTEIRLYRNVRKIEFRYTANKLILTDPEALYVAFPFALKDSRIVFETIGGILTQGEQLPGSSSDWNVAQNFVAVRGKSGQVIIVSNEVPLWHFSDFNMGKFERYPVKGKPWLYSWVMNNYWFTNFRAYQEGAFSWGYQLTSSGDTSNTFATHWAWGERNPFLTRTFPAGTGELKIPSFQTLKLSGTGNVLPVNSRPVFNRERTILLHLRELEGLPGEVEISSAAPGQMIRKMTEVNSFGKPAARLSSVIPLKPYEVKFVELEF
ncbi:MAG TPA: glycoside hydrolase family 38 C-terminal domain-containing protein [Bacteroidales bacterium]|jgi:hypothetical protein|nr:glycoside hydrolase family 38 C-terminal domain-containing protein [Bacteroidales bacterium]HQH22766.1 glycoside hydrolase family 38 C-terminal domain-containing protein [Bacteroidales bacterium]HQJ83513.1 glycoside hydrolase family 38 C-terminal domain-containing protein [Bacteroidales bacterium]